MGVYTFFLCLTDFKEPSPATQTEPSHSFKWLHRILLQGDTYRKYHHVFNYGRLGSNRLMSLPKPPYYVCMQTLRVIKHLQEKFPGVEQNGAERGTLIVQMTMSCSW